MAHEDYKELLAAQALNALEAAEVRDLEAHLQTCPECRAQLSEWEDTAVALTFASVEVRPLEPSQELRGRILEAVRVDAARRVREVDDDHRPQLSNVVPLRRPGKWLSVPVWGAIAAGLVFAALLVPLFVLWKQNREARQEITRLLEQTREANEQIVQQRSIMDLVTAPGTRMAELAGTKVMPGAHAMIAYDKNGRAVLMAKGLPAPPAGKAYQLWFIAGGKPMPGRVFTTDASGTGMLKDQIPAEALNAAIFAITLEPKDGMQAPTGAIYLSSAT